MKQGDIVQITDGSYTRSIVGGKLIKEFLNYRHNNDDYGPVKGRKYVVVKMDFRFPILNSCQPEKYRNDTIIQDTLSGKVVFIYHGFLKVTYPKHTIIIDGRIIELSSESFKNLKEQLI